MLISTKGWGLRSVVGWLHILLFLSVIGGNAQAQALPASPADTTLHKYQTLPGAARQPWYQSKLVRASIVPAVLIGYGISVYDDHGFYSSAPGADATCSAYFPGRSSHSTTTASTRPTWS